MPRDLLTSLAADINTAHRRAIACARRAVGDAVACGELLLRAKDLVGHGQWLKWLAKHCPDMSDRTARAWMQIAEHRDVVQDAGGVAEALRMIATPSKTATVADLARRERETEAAEPTREEFKALPPSGKAAVLQRLEEEARRMAAECSSETRGPSRASGNASKPSRGAGAQICKACGRPLAG